MTLSPLQRATWLILAAVAVVSVVALFVLSRPIPLEEVLPTAGALGYGLVGAVVARRRPANAIGWMYQVIGALLALLGLANFWTAGMLEHGPPLAGWETAVAWIYSWAWIPLLTLATTFTFLLYPSGLPSRRWRPVLWFSVAVTATVTVLAAMLPTVDIGVPGVDEEAFTVANPVAPTLLRGIDLSQEPWSAIALAMFAMAVGCGLAAVWAVVLRTWRSRGVERLQMRLFTVVILLVPIQVVVSGVVPGFADSVLADSSFALIMLLIPVSSGVAILRYHLYDIDRIIGRTTAYALVTGVLLAVYVVVVASVGQLLPDSSDLAVAAATLSAAALFRPVLRWAQGVVARRFNREQYDAERVVDIFAVRLRDEVEGSSIRSRLIAVLDETVQPASAGLWLKGPVR